MDSLIPDNSFDSKDSSVPEATDQPIQINEPSVTEPEPPAPSPVSEDTGALMQDMNSIMPSAQAEEDPSKDIDERIKKNKKKAKIISIIVIIAVVVAISVAIVVAVLFQEAQRKENFIAAAKQFGVAIRELNDNKGVYYYKTYGPKVELGKSPYNTIYRDSSYATNYYNHVYVCLTDGNRRASGYLDENIEFETGDVPCEYSFRDHENNNGDSYDYDEKQAYIKMYADKEYKYMNPKVEKKEDKYYIESDFFTFEIDAKIDDLKIKVDSTLDKAEDEYYQKADLLDIAEYYVRKYYQTTSIAGKPVYQIFVAKSDLYYIRMLTSMEYNEGIQFMEEFRSYAEKHNIPLIGQVVDIASFYTDEQTGNIKPHYYIVVGQKASTGEYITYKQLFD